MTTHRNRAGGAGAARTPRRLFVLALGLVCAGAIPSAALATAKPVTVSYKVPVRQGALASGRTVAATAMVANPRRNMSGWWSPQTVGAVIRTGVNASSKKPYTAQGYRCTRAVRGDVTSFTCNLRGADVPISVKLTFAVKYARGRLGSTSAGGQDPTVPVVMNVTGLPAHSDVALVFGQAFNAPYPGSILSFHSDSGATLSMPHDGVVILGDRATVDATLTSAVDITEGASAFNGIATVPTGATLTVGVNGHRPVTVDSGQFSLPLS